MIALAVSAVAALGAANAAVVIGADADTFVRNGSDSDENYGSLQNLLVKRQGAPNFEREAFVRFDLSNFSGSFIGAVLGLTQTNDNDQQIRVFGLNDGRDGWDESTVTWDSSGALRDRSLATDLGTIDLTQGGTGDALTLSGTALETFLANNIGMDGLVTFLLVSTRGSDTQPAIVRARENILGGGPTLALDGTVPVPAAALLFAPVAGIAALRRRRAK
ncbi:CBM96 family carbohydrate-binding protein [Parvularcula maris]|uniref:DNRLRE domain-containing protein n=1 Tax=Parvularcula maris TaxID=2965077 RepID=A0A9X2L7H5_9PROT|nr:DNRLRE domain-containing protein [Parvularcula maris]MCQ8184510.1 DNRLRE domain-containing protein [Parvularcula maris]